MAVSPPLSVSFFVDKRIEPTLADMQHAVHQLALDKGWWDLQFDATCEGDGLRRRSTVEALALIGCEVSEAVECVRDGQLEAYTREDGKPEGLPSELADVVIRCMDLAGHLGIDLSATILAKHEYNKSRPFRHGGKRL